MYMYTYKSIHCIHVHSRLVIEAVYTCTAVCSIHVHVHVILHVQTCTCILKIMLYL